MASAFGIGFIYFYFSDTTADSTKKAFFGLAVGVACAFTFVFLWYFAKSPSQLHPGPTKRSVEQQFYFNFVEKKVAEHGIVAITLLRALRYRGPLTTGPFVMGEVDDLDALAVEHMLNTLAESGIVKATAGPSDTTTIWKISPAVEPFLGDILFPPSK